MILDRCSQFTSWFISPAYHLENLAFNPSHQASKHKDAIARVTAAVAPFLFLYQVPVHGIVGIADFSMAVCGITPGIVGVRGMTSATNSLYLALTSTLEIPHKIWNGHKNPPHYFPLDNRCRYHSFHWFERCC